MFLKKFLKRLLVVFPFLVILAFTVFSSVHIFFLLIVIAGSIACGIEFYKILEKKGEKPFKFLGYTCIVFLLIFFYLTAQEKIHSVFDIKFAVTLTILVIICAGLGRKTYVASINNISTTLCGVFYVGFLPGFMILMKALERGEFYLTALFSIVWMTDFMAFLIGVNLGRFRNILPMSPTKSIEGIIGGFLGGIITSFFVWKWFFQDLPLLQFLLFGFILSGVSQVGDWIESMFKRDAEIKDSSSFIPGHGGFLDVFDSVIFAAPFAYYYIIVVFI